MGTVFGVVALIFLVIALVALFIRLCGFVVELATTHFWAFVSSCIVLALIGLGVAAFLSSNGNTHLVGLM